MKIRTVLAAMTLLPMAAMAQPKDQPKAEPNPATNHYVEVPGFFKLPAGRSMGSSSAVMGDSKGNIWVVDRCAANSCVGSKLDPVMEFDAKGNFVKSFGAGLLQFAHGFTIDRNDHLWITDGVPPGGKGTQGHTVMEFDSSGKLLRTMGKPGVRGSAPDGFTEPNAVLVAPDGSIFVAEAHSAQFMDAPGPGAIGRISKFSPEGKFIKSWGSFGFGTSQFRGPHSFAMDSRGRLFVADRGNRRVQIFDQEGKHLDTWYQFSRISGLYIDAKDTLYAIDSESDDNYNPGWRKGLRVGSARTGEVWYFVPEHVSKQASGMGGYGSMGEGVAVDAAGNVYGGEVGPIQGVTKFVPRLKR